MSGLIAGIMEVLLVGGHFQIFMLAISGPAAGLTVIVLIRIIGNGLFSSLFKPPW